VLALVGGVVLAAVAGGGLRWATAPAPSAGSPLTLVPLDIEAQSPSPGVVRLTFDPSQVPDTRLITVERDGQTVVPDVSTDATFYELDEPDPRGRHCYRVQAITSTPPDDPASAAPSCLVADGGAGPDEAGAP
jgi:serine/threonine-protein kinase